MGINETDDNLNDSTKQRNGSKLLIYQNNFQNKFIEATRNYYRQESAEFLQANTVTEYLKKVEKKRGKKIIIKKINCLG